MFTRIDRDGRPLSFEPVMRPVMALGGGDTRGAALDRGLITADDRRPGGAALDKLSAYDLEQLDEWMLVEGLASVDQREARGALLFVPVAFSTLATPRGRQRLTPLLTAALTRLGARLVLEITHLDPGLPPSRLVEVLTALKPICRVVFARLRPRRAAVAAVSGCTLAGAAVEASDLTDPEDAESLTRFRLVLRAIGPSLMIHNLRTVTAINAARAAGVTYASLDIGPS
jgi:hypothetical protein